MSVVLQGWVILWVPPQVDYPLMVSDIADASSAWTMAEDMVRSGRAAEIIAVCPAEALPRWVCPVPPKGWRCTRMPGHDGPCAAIPVGVSK